MNLNQNKINKRSGKRCSDFSQLEEEFQLVQTHYTLHQDKESWDKMFYYINLAVFNCVNKKLENKLPKDVIEERSLDITLNILRSLKNKMKKGKPWQISKVSSFVYLPCRALYSEQLQFEDKILAESVSTINPEELTSEKFRYQQENGIYSEGDFDEDY